MPPSSLNDSCVFLFSPYLSPPPSLSALHATLLGSSPSPSLLLSDILDALHSTLSPTAPPNYAQDFSDYLSYGLSLITGLDSEGKFDDPTIVETYLQNSVLNSNNAASSDAIQPSGNDGEAKAARNRGRRHGWVIVTTLSSLLLHLCSSSSYGSGSDDGESSQSHPLLPMIFGGCSRDTILRKILAIASKEISREEREEMERRERKEGGGTNAVLIPGGGGVSMIVSSSSSSLSQVEEKDGDVDDGGEDIIDGNDKRESHFTYPLTTVSHMTNSTSHLLYLLLLHSPSPRSLASFLSRSHTTLLSVLKCFEEGQNRSNSVSTRIPSSRNNNSLVTNGGGVRALIEGVIAPVVNYLNTVATSNGSPPKVTLPVIEKLLTSILIPLYLPNGYTRWRDQTPVISRWSSPTTSLVTLLTSSYPDLVPLTFCRSVLKNVDRGGAWPNGFNANTGKVVDLLHAVGLVCKSVPLHSTKNASEKHKMIRADLCVDIFDTVWGRFGDEAMEGNGRCAEMGLAGLRGIGDVGKASVEDVESRDEDGREEDTDDDESTDGNIIGGVTHLLMSIAEYPERLLPRLQRIISTLVPNGGGKAKNIKPQENSAATWNPTVRKFLGVVIKGVVEVGLRCCDDNDDCDSRCGGAKGKWEEWVDLNYSLSPEDGGVKGFGLSVDSPDENKADDDWLYSSSSSSEEEGEAPAERDSKDSFNIDPSLLTVRGAMGAFRASSGGSSRQGSSQNVPRNPSAVVTGVAPWAVGRSGVTNKAGRRGMGPMKSLPSMKSSSPSMLPPSMPSRGGLKRKSEPKADSKTGLETESKPETKAEFKAEYKSVVNAEEKSAVVMADSTAHAVTISGVERLLSYSDFLLPPHLRRFPPSSTQSQTAAQNSTPASTEPLLTNTLKFHSLVFGQTLGTGTFSTVKYSKLIIPGNVPRSSWPIYATKIIDESTISKNNYDASWIREVGALTMLSKTPKLCPNIVRIVSHFRFRDKGVFIVLEHCEHGDLFDLVRGTEKRLPKVLSGLSERPSKQVSTRKSCGFSDSPSLSPDSQGLALRVIASSISAALKHLHSLGLVFGDLKPENVMITGPGNVLKLCDFGGVRGKDRDGRRRLRDAAKNARDVRDGDWRVTKKEEGKEEGREEEKEGGTVVEEGESDSDFSEDGRIESTVAYLPPEMTEDSRGEVVETHPTEKTDIWALGCVLFFCCVGRVPILGGGGGESWEKDNGQSATWEIDSDGRSSIRVAFQDDDVDGEGKGCNKGGLRNGSSAVSSHPFFSPVPPPHPLQAPSNFSSHNTLSLIATLCEVDPNTRINDVTDIENHDFFRECGLKGAKEGLSLSSKVIRRSKKANEGGQSEQGENDEWSRRQHSKIWAPQPVTERQDRDDR